jgi:predicted tellurium resistance membrane protein TerC
MVELLTDPQAWLAFATLTALEIVLGIDNIIFISILVGRLPKEQQARGRTFGLALAMVTRILLLLSITWVMSLSNDLFEVFSIGVSGRDLILIAGGLFLLAKSTLEIHSSLEGAHDDHEDAPKRAAASFIGIIAQIAIIDIVFSLDSVITAVGMADHVEVMIAAVVAAVLVMMFMAGPIGNFVDRHPTIKILALSFLVLIGVALVGEGVGEDFGFHIPKGYIYFAMAFSVIVELLNMRMRKRQTEPVKLRRRLDEAGSKDARG